MISSPMLICGRKKFSLKNCKQRVRATGFCSKKAARLKGQIKPIAGLSTHSTAPLISCTGIPHFAVSIALERDGKLVAGVIYNPITDELFSAERGSGAFYNHGRLRVAGRTELADAVLACGAPHGQRAGRDEFLAEMETLLPKVAGIRRFGAASLDLAFVAAGRVDGFWERGLAPWDMAAGVVLVREAGGLVSDETNRQRFLESGTVVAGNEAIHGALLKNLKK